MHETKKAIGLVLGFLIVLGTIVLFAVTGGIFGQTVMAIGLLFLVVILGRKMGLPAVETAVVQNSVTADSEVIAEPVQPTPNDVIVEIIRTKGQARRSDFLKVLKMPKTSLGRILDEMEKQGVIVQRGENKGSHYVLKSLNNI